MKDVVLDTNVLVAGLKSSLGASFRLLQMAGREDRPFQYHLSASMALEYEEVLMRHFIPTPYTRVEIDAFLDDLINGAVRHSRVYGLRPLSSDPDDDAILELAIGLRLDAVITFNLGHMKPAEEYGVSVLTPPQFLKKILL